MAKNNQVTAETTKPIENAVEHKSSCSILALAITLIVILLVLLSGLFYLKFHNVEIINSEKSKDLPLSAKIENQIADQKNDDSITLTINEMDLNSLLNNYSNFPLKNPTLTIDEKGILMKGKYSVLNVEVLIVPKIENNKIKYDIVEIKAAGVAAPKKISDTLNSELSTFISSQLPSSKKIKFEEMTLQKGIIQATGKKI